MSDNLPEKESFDVRKFVRGLNPFDLIAWAKTFIFTFRIAIVAALVVGVIYGVGYFKGGRNTPVTIDLKEDVEMSLVDKDGKSHKLEVRNRQLYFDGNIQRTKDIPSLKPYGIELVPKLGTGITSKGEFTGGLALEVGHFYDFNLDLILFHLFQGIGLSYDLKYDGFLKIRNTSIGIGLGRDSEIMVYGTVKF